MSSARMLDFSLLLFGAALPLSLAAANAALGLLSLGLLAALAAGATRGAAAARLKEAAGAPLFAALAAYAVASLVAGLAGIGCARSLSLWPKDLHKLWVVLVVGAALEARRRTLFARGLAAGAAAAAVIGIAQTLAYSGSRPYLRAHAFMHAVSYGESLGLVFLGLLIAGEEFLSPRARRAAIGALAAALLLNQTRAVLVALVAGLAAIAVAAPRWRRALLAVLAAGAAVVVAWEFMPTGRHLSDLVKGGLNGLHSGRLTMWRVGWEAFRDHPWTGVGPGHYRTVFSSYFPGAIEGEPNWGSAHNLFLHQAAERGLLGLVALAAVCATLGAGVVRRARARADGWTLWALAACAAFLVMNLTETAFQTEQVATLFLAVVLLSGAAHARD